MMFQKSGQSENDSLVFSDSAFFESDYGSEDSKSIATKHRRQINEKSATLTDYTLLMLNFIPATIIQQLCKLD